MMILPFAYLVIFHYVPMAGIVLAFQDYKMGRGVFGSDWVGFRWFIEFFESFYFWRLMRNTLLLSFYTIVFGFPVPILFALMLNEMRVLPLKRIVQTVSYLPHFISLVIIVGMLVTFLSPNNGIVNIVIKWGGGGVDQLPGPAELVPAALHRLRHLAVVRLRLDHLPGRHRRHQPGAV